MSPVPDDTGPGLLVTPCHLSYPFDPEWEVGRREGGREGWRDEEVKGRREGERSDREKSFKLHSAAPHTESRWWVRIKSIENP